MSLPILILLFLHVHQCMGVDPPPDAFPGDALDYTNSKCTPPAKAGSCPSSSNLINPSSKMCDSDFKCSGLRLCCASSSGSRYCSDPFNSFSKLKCPRVPAFTAADKVRSCKSDVNCLETQKCCFDNTLDSCKTYCIAGEESEAVACVKSITTVTKSGGNCPATLPADAKDSCQEQKDCAGNLVCCGDSNGCKKCTAPTTNPQVTGTCPSPDLFTNSDFVKACFADADCDGGLKCCHFESCHYYCAKTKAKIGKRSADAQLKRFVCRQIDPLCPRNLTNPGAPCQTRAECGQLELCCGEPGKKFCHAPFGSKKGNCPAPNAGRKLSASCKWDIDCPGEQKCCGGFGCRLYGCVNPE